MKFFTGNFFIFFRVNKPRYNFTHFSSLYFWAFTSMKGLIPLLVTISAPVAFVKSGIAFVQLCYAARNLAEIDAKDASKKS